MDVVKLEVVENKIVEIRGKKVLLDSDVAELYGVETRDINKAVKNNPDKFPGGYTFVLNKSEFEGLRWKFSTTNEKETSIEINFAVLKFKHSINKVGKKGKAVKENEGRRWMEDGRKID